MYGVAATRRRVGVEGTPPWVPENALAHLDFVNGQYYANGATWPVATLLGSGFDAGEIVAGGMKVWFTNSNRPDFSGALAAVIDANLSSGFTIIIEMDDPSSDIDGPLLVMTDTPANIDANWLFQSYITDSSPTRINYSDFDALSDADSFASFAAGGINRIGITYNRPLGGGQWRYARSVNGDAALTNDVGYDGGALFPTDGPARIRLGYVEPSQAFDSALFRSITVYAAVDETELAALTAIPTA